MNDLWRSFDQIQDIKGLTDKEQIQYWKYSYWQAYQMFIDCSENSIDQRAFYMDLCKNLRAQLIKSQEIANER